jgi:hypothetical protein
MGLMLRSEAYRRAVRNPWLMLPLPSCLAASASAAVQRTPTLDAGLHLGGTWHQKNRIPLYPSTRSRVLLVQRTDRGRQVHLHGVEGVGTAQAKALANRCLWSFLPCVDDTVVFAVAVWAKHWGGFRFRSSGTLGRQVVRCLGRRATCRRGLSIQRTGSSAPSTAVHCGGWLPLAGCARTQ